MFKAQKPAEAAGIGPVAAGKERERRRINNKNFGPAHSKSNPAFHLCRSFFVHQTHTQWPMRTPVTIKIQDGTIRIS